MANLEETYNKLCTTPSDINEHLPTLKQYGEKCETITEMGVRWVVSTYALLSSKPKKLISYDIKSPEYYNSSLNLVKKFANEIGTLYNFIEQSTLEVEIDNTDLLFIDTWHTYPQLYKELTLHASRVNKYIILHDTVSFGYVNESNPGFNLSNKTKNILGLEFPGEKGLVPAMKKFLSENSDWEIDKVYTNNNGLTILKRI